jgi:hypothetical protein
MASKPEKHLSRLDIPQAQSAKVGTCCHQLAVRRESCQDNGSTMTAQFVHQFAGIRIPNSRHAIGARSHDERGVRAEFSPMNLIAVAQKKLRGAGYRVPYLRNAVSGRGDYETAIRTITSTEKHIVVWYGEEPSAVCNVPNPRGFIPTGAEDMPAVRAE